MSRSNMPHYTWRSKLVNLIMFGNTDGGISAFRWGIERGQAPRIALAVTKIDGTVISAAIVDETRFEQLIDELVEIQARRKLVNDH